MSDCLMCDRYLEERLPDVARIHFAETGRRVDVVAFMAGVHKRHLAHLPIFPKDDRLHVEVRS